MTYTIDTAPRLAALKQIQALVNTEINYYTNLSATPVPAPTPTPAPTPAPTLSLVTNEYAYWNPNDPTSIKSTTWDMTSGSLFLQNGKFWSGVPDDIDPNAKSTNGTNSAVFRLNSKNFGYRNFTVSFDYTKNNLVTTPSTPAVDWDGAHIFLRYVSQYNLYYASFDRRDGLVMIKKKCLGGTDNGGTYYIISSTPSHPIVAGTLNHISASIVTNPDNSVTIKLYNNGTLLTQGTDTGVGCGVILAGAVGLRGDNNNFTFSNFTTQ